MQKNLVDKRETLDESDSFETPWMASVPNGHECYFEIDRSRTFVETIEAPFETTGSRDTIEQVRAEMRAITDPDGDQIDGDGEHIVPWWACAPLKKALKQSSKKTWVGLVYVHESEKEEREDRTVTINSAKFALQK